MIFDPMFLYDIFAILAMIGGVYSGVYFARHLARLNKADKLLFALVSIYVITVFWTAGVYLATYLDIIVAGGLTTGLFIRPATMVLLWAPALIMQRLGL